MGILEMEKLISSNGNLYKVVMLPTGGLRFFVRAGYNFRAINTAPAIARITAAMVEADHAEALEMDEEFNAARYPAENAQKQFSEIAPEVRGEVIAEFHAEALEMNYRIDCTAHLKCRHMDAVDQEYVAMRNEAEAMNASFDTSFHRAAKNWGAMCWFSRERELAKAHTEALRMDAQIEQDAWDNADRVGREMAIEFAHDEALTMDTEYRIAIATIADNLTLPVWDGCSATVKREVVKHHHAEALRENQKHDEAIIYFAERGPFTEIQMRQIVAYCHGQALKMDAARTVY